MCNTTFHALLVRWQSSLRPRWEGRHVLPDFLGIAKFITRAGKQCLIEGTSHHDDDLVPWAPTHPEDDLAPKSFVWKRLHEIREILDDAGQEINSSICNLHGNPILRDGGLCSPNPEIRRLARLKVERTPRIGQFFGAMHYVYWVARDDFEVPVVTKWGEVYNKTVRTILPQTTNANNIYDKALSQYDAWEQTHRP